jgi:hypothetical protein
VLQVLAFLAPGFSQPRLFNCAGAARAASTAPWPIR